MSSLEGGDRMFSVAAPQARGKSAQDNIFAANNRAVALADKIGKDKVINGTVGSILDEDGNLVELEVVKEAYARLSPRQIIAYAPIQGYEKFLESCIDQCFGESGRTDTLMPVRLRAVQERFIMPSITILLMGMKF